MYVEQWQKPFLIQTAEIRLHYRTRALCSNDSYTETFAADRWLNLFFVFHFVVLFYGLPLTAVLSSVLQHRVQQTSTSQDTGTQENVNVV
jgi:hypothetical protein